MEKEALMMGHLISKHRLKHKDHTKRATMNGGGKIANYLVRTPGMLFVLIISNKKCRSKCPLNISFTFEFLFTDSEGGEFFAVIWCHQKYSHTMLCVQLALMVVQLLLKRCKDVDSFVRAASLRTLASLRISTLLEELKEPILVALEDPSPVVRCAAVVAVLKVQVRNIHNKNEPNEPP